MGVDAEEQRDLFSRSQLARRIAPPISGCPPPWLIGSSSAAGAGSLSSAVEVGEVVAEQRGRSSPPRAPGCSRRTTRTSRSPRRRRAGASAASRCGPHEAAAGGHQVVALLGGAQQVPGAVLVRRADPGRRGCRTPSCRRPARGSVRGRAAGAPTPRRAACRHRSWCGSTDAAPARRTGRRESSSRCTGSTPRQFSPSRITLTTGGSSARAAAAIASSSPTKCAAASAPCQLRVLEADQVGEPVVAEEARRCRPLPARYGR